MSTQCGCCEAASCLSPTPDNCPPPPPPPVVIDKLSMSTPERKLFRMINRQGVDKKYARLVPVLVVVVAAHLLTAPDAVPANIFAGMRSERVCSSTCG